MNEILSKIKITDMNANGKGIFRKDGKVVFCNDCVDEDIVDVKIIEQNKNYDIAKKIALDVPSPNRIPVDCQYYSLCGGCTLRNISYEHEIEIKKNTVIQALRKKHIEINLNKIIYCDEYRYRNKAIFHFADNCDLSYYENKTHSTFDMCDCYIVPKNFINVCNYTSKYFKKNNIIKDPVSLFIRSSQQSFIVVLQIEKYDKNRLLDYAKDLSHSFSFITGIIVTKKNIIYGNVSEMDLLFGIPYVTEKLLDATFSVSPTSFFQVNHSCSEIMFNDLLNLLSNMEHDSIIDMYCGTGVISILAAKKFPMSKIYGIDISKDSIINAKENAENNNIKNAIFINSSSSDYLYNREIKSDVIILDPPRSGCKISELETIIKSKIKNIIYVSCNPFSLANNVSVLTDNNYNIRSSAVYNMFPRTPHVETVVLMSRISGGK